MKGHMSKRLQDALKTGDGNKQVVDQMLRRKAMTPPDPVPLLEDQEARLLLKYLDARGSVMALDGLKLREPLSAIATERAKVCLVMTEEQWRMLFWKLVPVNGAVKPSDMAVALARHLGLVSDAQERAK